VVHVVEPALTIVPGREDAYYTLTVPTEAAHGAGDELVAQVAEAVLAGRPIPPADNNKKPTG
jgi:hypothetical protein